MNRKFQNAFFVFGLVVLVVMMTQLDYAEVWRGLRRAGYWFLAVVGLWLVLYAINTASWYLIIRQGNHKEKKQSIFSFLWLYKVTVSGFALNYATPGGLMGGEAYRIMELAPKVGMERASSSVILYVMTHIFSHFWFWLLSVVICLFTVSLTPAVCLLLFFVALFCMLGLWFFMKGYKNGLAIRLAKCLSLLPWIGKWARGVIESHSEQLETIDRQIAALHSQNPINFVVAVALELICRFLSSFEIMFVLLVVMPEVSYWSCVMMLAFTSLFANLLFFIPLQLGGREGGFMMSASGLAITASNGIFVALIVRLRELFWTALGLFLIKVERNGKSNKKIKNQF